MNQGYCSLHGTYFGFACPSCGGATMPPTPVAHLDPTPTLMRIALTLERIAVALEALAPSVAGTDTPGDAT